MEKDRDNKKTLILSIIGILVLVIAVVGVSFAMYTFTGSGNEINTIQTGTITMNIDPDNNFEFTNEYPMTDEEGIAQTDNVGTIGVSGTWSSTVPMTIYYDLGVVIVSEGATLTDDYIKIALLKGDEVIVGTADDTTGALTEGVVLSSLASTAGPNNLVKTYGLAGGTLSTSGTVDNYTIQAWVSDQYDLAIDPDNTTADQDASGTLDDQDGRLHQKQTASETFVFKVVLEASQTQGA